MTDNYILCNKCETNPCECWKNEMKELEMTIIDEDGDEIKCYHHAIKYMIEELMK